MHTPCEKTSHQKRVKRGPRRGLRTGFVLVRALARILMECDPPQLSDQEDPHAASDRHDDDADDEAEDADLELDQAEEDQGMPAAGGGV